MTLLAYIDPGSGLFIWQMVGAIFLGFLFYFKKVRGFLGKLCHKVVGKKHP